jgi:hypothetical protein
MTTPAAGPHPHLAAPESVGAIGAVEVPTANGEVLRMMPDDVGRLAAFDPPAEEQIQLLAGADSLVLLWQYDPAESRIAHGLFAGTTPAVTRRIAEVEAWIRDELGDFRSFSLDSPASRRDRIDALNAAGTA